MPLRPGLLSLAVVALGSIAILSGVAAADEHPAAPPPADVERVIIIRPSTEPPVEPAAAVAPTPTATAPPEHPGAWVVSGTGRFLNVPAAPALVDAGAGAVSAAATTAAEGHERYEVDAIFSAAAEPEPAARPSPGVVNRAAARPTPPEGGTAEATPSRPPRTAKASSVGKPKVKRKATPNRRAKAKAERPSKAAARVGGRSSGGARAGKSSTGKSGRAGKPEAAKQRGSVKPAGTSRQRKGASASQRRQARIRAATAKVKRTMRRKAADRRRAMWLPPQRAVPVRTVQGITVHRRIAGRTQALLRAADRANLRLNGWGYRSTQRQIQLRRDHCGRSRYALYRMPAGRCWPPTAPPGKSMHERGLAIDFYVEGRKGRPKPIAGTTEFRWLRRNAAKYGFYNLPSEAWHWSTNGR